MFLPAGHRHPKRGIPLDQASEIPIWKPAWERNKCTDSPCAVRHILLEAEGLFRGGALGSSSTGDEYRDFKNNPLTDALNTHMAFVCMGTLLRNHTYTPVDG